MSINSQKFLSLITLSLIVGYSYADPLTTDDSVVSLPKIQTQTPKTANPVGINNDNLPPNTAQNFTDQDLKTNARLADQVLGDALKAQDWKTIQHILSFYSEIPEYDPLMVLYMQGALDRHYGKYKSAIVAYQSMSQQAPELANVKFDLAAMLFENKQYYQSQKLLKQLSLQENIDPYIYAATLHYLSIVNKNIAWQGSLQLGYKYNDNVNNASDGRILHLFGLEFIKPESSLPQSDYALEHSLSAQKDFSLKGNHYLSMALQESGSYYNQLDEWNETNVSFKTGYKYQNYNSWFSVMPQFYQQILNGKSYRSMAGTALEYGQWLQPKWQSILNYAWLDKKYYGAGLEYYEGNLHSLNWTNAYIYRPNTIFIQNFNIQKDDLNSKDESSNKLGFGLGLIQNHPFGQMRLNANFNRSQYQDYNLWDLDKKRNDKEYQFNAIFTANTQKLGGFAPSLSYQYLDIVSNIPSFYSRKNQQIVLSLEKSF